MLLVLGLSLIGESLNDVLNPLLRARRLSQVVMPGRVRRDRAQVVGAADTPGDDSAYGPDGSDGDGSPDFADGSMDKPFGQGTIGGTR